ncbi:MAG: DNA ligase (NAD+), partial [Rhodocyclaceae bacterium]
MADEYTKTYTGVLTAQDGTRRHFINGAPGRDGDLPAVEYPDGGVVFYRGNPKRGGMGQRASLEHRDGGPAVVRANGDRFWYQMGKLHRDDGPAVEMAGGVQKWFVNGEFVRASKPSPPSSQPIPPVPTMNDFLSPADRIAALRARVSELAHAYYVLDKPLVSDGEYDVLFRELEQIELAHPELASSDSPTQRVGGAPLKELPSVTHRTPMLSLANAMDESEARRWLQSCADELGVSIEDVSVVMDDKFDGLAITLTYQEGLLV